MNVTKIKLMVDQVIGGVLFFKGAVFYVTEPQQDKYGLQGDSLFFTESGAKLGYIKGHYSEWSDGKVFKSMGGK